MAVDSRGRSKEEFIISQGRTTKDKWGNTATMRPKPMKEGLWPAMTLQLEKKIAR